MRSHSVAFPFVLAASVAGFHACQPSAPATRVPAAGSSASSASQAKACGITVLYQNNTDAEIEPCG